MQANRSATTTLVFINLVLICAITLVMSGFPAFGAAACLPLPALLTRLWRDPRVLIDQDVLIVERGNQRVTLPLAEVVAVERRSSWPLRRYRLCFRGENVLGSELSFDMEPGLPWNDCAAPIRTAICTAHQHRGAAAQRRALDARYDSEPTEIMSRRALSLLPKRQAHV